MAIDKYSVILMRDDHTVKHFHFRPIWIRIVIFSIIFILSVSTLFGYVSVKLWLKTNYLNERIEQKDVQLQQNIVRLNRLENIEKVVAFRDPEQLEKLLTGQLADLYSPDSTSKVNLWEYYKTIETDRFSIENLKVKSPNAHTLTLRFDLKNQDDGKAVRGKADIVILTDSAKLVEKGLSDNNQIFQIKHFKTFTKTIHLPDGMSTKNIFALRLVISGPQGNVLYGITRRLDDLIT